MQPCARETCLDEAFERIEEAILPALSLMIDSLLEAAALARPGIDAESHAAELRRASTELESLIRHVEACPAGVPTAEAYRIAGATTAA